MSKTYTPQPGTIPYRAVQYLQRLQPGADIANGPLADELDVSTNTLISCLATAVHHGVIKRDRREGLIYWSLGDGTPLPAAPDAEDDQDMKSKIIITPAAVAAMAKANDKLAKRLEKAVAVGPTKDAQVVNIQIELDLPPPEPVFGAFSDGSLSIKHGDSFVSLGEKHARALQEFMNRAWAPT